MSKSLKSVSCLVSFVVEVDRVQVHPVLVAVGEEVDLVVRSPHRDDVLGWVIGQVLGLLGLEVVDPDVVGHAAAVALPGAELAEDAVVGQLLAVGRERAKPPRGSGSCSGRPPSSRHGDRAGR